MARAGDLIVACALGIKTTWEKVKRSEPLTSMRNLAFASGRLQGAAERREILLRAMRCFLGRMKLNLLQLGPF